MKTDKAFTLTEVLITLGIIGIVAAITLPTLIQNYRNHVVETRLEKFYSTFNRALQMAEAEYGDKKYWYLDASGVQVDENGNIIDGTAAIDNWFKKYMKSLVIAKKEIDTSGRVLYYLPDGSAFQLGSQGVPSLRSIYFYPGNPERCKITDTNSSMKYLGTCVFMFHYKPNDSSLGWTYHYNKGMEPCKYKWNGIRSTLKTSNLYGCMNTNELNSNTVNAYCTALIQLNGWEIPKDYPHKVWF